MFGDISFTAVVLKRPIVGNCSNSTAAVAWGRLTAGEEEAGLAAARALAVQWWLEERQLVDAGHLVKTVEVYQYAGSS